MFALSKSRQKFTTEMQKTLRKSKEKTIAAAGSEHEASTSIPRPHRSV